MRLTLGKSASDSISDILTYLMLIVLGAIILVPVAWMLSTSLKSDGETFLFPPVWIPEKLHWENYFRSLTFLPFGRYLLNTSVITVSAVIGQLLTSPLVAFGFARLNCRRKDGLFMLVLATMMLPAQVTMVPVFVMFRIMGWVNTYLPLIVPNYFGSPYLIFLLRQFMLTIPPELGDAAKIDGCGYFGIYSRIWLPLCKPALATVGIFTFMYHWNDFMTPLIYLSTNEKWTLTLGLSRFAGIYGTTPWNLLMACSLVTILPCIVLYFFAQGYFIQGIVITGVKG